MFRRLWATFGRRPVAVAPEISPTGRETTDDLGLVVGGFRIETRVASGGMAHVYAASHVEDGRRAAVKIITSRFAEDEAMIRRFHDEARIIASVRHPNVVEIVDFLEVESPRRFALIMELLEGPSLTRALEAGLTFAQSLHVALQLAEALEAVHVLGVVHRDLKPDNVMVVGSLRSDLSAVPSVKLLDFGIAKDLGGDPTERTGSASVVGTPAYVAPEQIAGDPSTPKTDVYALGEILFEAVTGQRAFAGKHVLRRKLAGEVPDLGLIPAKTPGGARLRALVGATLAPDPDERPTPQAVIRELRLCLAELTAAPHASVRRPARGGSRSLAPLRLTSKAALLRAAPWALLGAVLAALVALVLSRRR